MKVLILGGDGFIGSHLRAAHVILGDTVIAVDKNTYRTDKSQTSYRFYQSDLSYETEAGIQYLLNNHKPDLVYNCVAVATPAFYVKHPVETFNLDFEVNKKIIDALHNDCVPFIHFSTSEVYGKKWNEPYTEESDYILGPADKSRWIYATSKILLDQYILARGMNCCILRPFNFIGYDLDWLPDLDNANQIDKTWIPRVPSCFLNSLFSSKPMQIVYPGTQKRCYTYIDDAIQGILSVHMNWTKCCGEILNIGNPHNEITIEQLAGKMAAAWHVLTGERPKGAVYVNGEVLYGSGYEDSERRLFSDDKINKLTGWRAYTNIDETIYSVVEEAIGEYRP